MESPSSMCNAIVSPKPIYTGIRGVQYKYVEHHACDREVYNLSLDQYELQNQYNLTNETTRAQLAAWLAVMETCAAAACRAFEMGPPRTGYLPVISR